MRKLLNSQAIPYRFRPQGMMDYFWIYLFIFPFTILYIGFTLWPLVATFFYSFFDWNGITPLNWDKFIGLKNYIVILRDPIFWLSYKNTLIFAFTNTIIKLPLSLLAAIVLTRKWLALKRVFRTMFFSPLVIPVAMAGLIFTILLNPSNGAVNQFLLHIGLIHKPIDFLGHKTTAMLSLIFVSIWQIFGQYMIYWMAALQNVPEELYEAAEIDGANEWHKLIHITLPVISPIAVIILFLAFVNALRVFGLVVTMTAGGPGASTSVISYFIYKQAFSDVPYRYGYASSAAVFFGVTVLIAVMIQGYFVRRARQRQAEYGI